MNRPSISDAVKLREEGKIPQALEIFSEVLNEAESQKDYKTLVDVLGHIRICYQLLSENSDDNAESKLYANKALDFGLTAVEACRQYNLPSSTLSISKVHLAKAFLHHSKFFEDSEVRNSQLQTGLNELEEALSNFPGSKAHKAWALESKAAILFELGKVDKAISIVGEGLKCIFDGYEEEIKNPDGLMKMQIWQTGLLLVMAKMAESTQKIELAKMYAQMVHLYAKNNGLKNREIQADAITDKLK